jgi:hypothetical protein
MQAQTYDDCALIWGDDVTGEGDSSGMAIFEDVLHAIPEEEGDVGVDGVCQKLVERHDGDGDEDEQ